MPFGDCGSASTPLCAGLSGIRGAALGLALALSAGCSEKGEKPAGGLSVEVSTELAVPKDIDLLRFEVRRFEKALATEERIIGEGNALLPTIFQVAPTGDAQPVVIRGIALKDGEPRIQ